MAVVVSRESFQCICCTVQNVNLYGTKKSKWNQIKNPDTLCYCGRHVGGINDCSRDTHMATCQVTFHNYLLQNDRKALVQAAGNLLLPLLPLDHFAINCRSFLRDSSFIFLKTKQLSWLIWKTQGCGQKRLVIIMPSYWVVCKWLHTAGTVVAEDALLNVTLTGFTGHRMCPTQGVKR